MQSGGVVANKPLKELNLRKVYDIIVIAVMRDGKRTDFPDGNFKPEVNDMLIAVGQIQNLKDAQIAYKGIDLDYDKVMNLHEFSISQQKDKNSTIKCRTFVIEENSPWIGHSLNEARLNNKTNCIVVGMERDDMPTANPSSDVKFKKDDMVWVLGDDKSLNELLKTDFFA